MSLPNWSHAYGPPPVQGVMRSVPEDFIVEEELGHEPDGDGGHLLVQVRKTGANTEWVARALAQAAGVRPQDVGFAGLKDRHAITTQWFSIAVGRADPDWAQWSTSEFQILAAARHRRKLHRGDLRGNRFQLRARDLQGDLERLRHNLEQIAARGVPNYFGEQRFGHDGGNLEQARALFARHGKERDAHKRGLYISAARSFLFNEVLSERVARGSWDQALEGECLVREGAEGFVCPDSVDSDRVRSKVAAGELHPSGPLWGRGRLPCRGVVAALEAETLAPFADLRQGLEHVGLDQERRSLRLKPAGFAGALDGNELVLSFSLPAGSYATTVVRELVDAGC